jgi:hypothetical protein
VQKWRAHAKISADFSVLAPAALSRALGDRGMEVRPGRIRLWAHRGLLTRANPDYNEDGKPLPAMYQLGAVRKLYTDMLVGKHTKESTHV